MTEKILISQTSAALGRATSEGYLRLGVNIDHVATLRNARGGRSPDPIRAAALAIKAGCDGITAHLREDRRHIRDQDIADLTALLKNTQGLNARPILLNLEVAATPEMLEIALKYKPHACCLVPERREEVTTEGGLDAQGQIEKLVPYSEALAKAGIRLSLFIDADEAQMRAAARLKAPVVEIHTGAYAEAVGEAREIELEKIRKAAHYGASLGLEIHAGHGLSFENVAAIAAISCVRELNIGHFLMGDALFTGLEVAIKTMRAHMDEARSGL